MLCAPPCSERREEMTRSTLARATLRVPVFVHVFVHVMVHVLADVLADVMAEFGGVSFRKKNEERTTKNEDSHGDSQFDLKINCNDPRNRRGRNRDQTRSCEVAQPNRQRRWGVDGLVVSCVRGVPDAGLVSRRGRVVWIERSRVDDDAARAHRAARPRQRGDLVWHAGVADSCESPAYQGQKT